MAQEARQVGLHHKGFLRDECLVEGAYLDVLCDGHALHVPAGEQLRYCEFVGGRAVLAGAHIGGEEGQCVEVGAHLHGLCATTLINAHRGTCHWRSIGYYLQNRRHFHHLLFFHYSIEHYIVRLRCGRLVHDASTPPTVIVGQSI